MSQKFEDQLDDIFADFINGQGSDESIKQLYETLPYLTHDQQRILTLYRTLAVRHNSAALMEMAHSIESFSKANRRTGLRFTRLLESFSLYKHFKGYKASSSMNEVNNS